MDAAGAFLVTEVRRPPEKLEEFSVRESRRREILGVHGDSPTRRLSGLTVRVTPRVTPWGRRVSLSEGFMAH